MYRIVYTRQASKDVKKLKSAKLDKKAKELIEIIRIDPFKDIPPYEKLVGNLYGAYSRRINIKHRLVYEIVEQSHVHDGIEYDGVVKILSMWTHYENIR